MATIEAPAVLHEEVLPEDRVRTDIYALLSALFYAPPPAELLNAISRSDAFCNEGSESAFCRAWNALRAAARDTDAESVRHEYDSTFISTGRAPVMLYASYYLAGFLMEKPLARLRDDLARMGYARQAARSEPEDHISALCDVMRLMIGGGGNAPADIAAQGEFFAVHIESWYARLCDAAGNAAQTAFYKHVAALARAFFDIESAAFDIA